MKTSFNSIKGIVLFGALIILCAACAKKETYLSAQEYLDQILARVDQTQLTTDLAIIDDSLAVWGLTNDIEIEPHGVRYLITEMGTGQTPSLEDPVRVKYAGRFLNTGAQFDASESFDFYIYDLIIGWQTTLPLLPEGTKATLYIPSGYGYGATNRSDNAGNVIIPANSNLVFEVELLQLL